MTLRLPTLFVSHGAPTLILEPDNPAHRLLTTLADAVPARPKAIVVATAHWTTQAPRVGAAEKPSVIHDFYGFPEELFQLDYPAPGDARLAVRVKTLLDAAGLAADLDLGQGLDHGVWVPLRLGWPAADIPVVPLAVQPALGAAHHIALGRALAPLADEGVLILGSGGAVHNLRAWRPGRTEPEVWAKRFDDMLTAAVESGDEATLSALAQTAEGRQSHPTDEHYLPLLVAFGAAGRGATGQTLLRGLIDGSLGLGCYRFVQR
ncbi:MAG: class III extradiol ring-cleavage dioxygenase [Rhodospirillaceae bacterium]